MCLPVHMESMQTFEAEYPCFTSVLALVLGVCTFNFVLKNERLCKDVDSFLYLWIIGHCPTPFIQRRDCQSCSND